MKTGIDVAKWQGAIDWVKVKAAGIAFAILKVTQKDNQVEGAFERNYTAASALGIILGMYRYVYAATIEAAQKEANAIVSVLSGRVAPMKIWLDMEDASIRNIGRDLLTQIILTEAGILQAAGYKVGIYCNQDWYDNVLDIGALSQFEFWVARFGPNNGQVPSDEYNPKNGRERVVAWQYTSTGHVDGIDGNVDMDLWYDELPNTSAPSIPSTEQNGASSTPVETSTAMEVVILASELNVRQGPGTNYGIATTVKKGEAFHIVEVSGHWGRLQSGAGWISISPEYAKQIGVEQAPQAPVQTASEKQVSIKVAALNIRKGPGTNYGVVGTVKKNEAFHIVEENNGWGRLQSGAGWICITSDYVNII